MPSVQHMRHASKTHADNINRRGAVKTSLKKKDEGANLPTYIVGLLVFVVCGSLIFQILQSIRLGEPVEF